jgi:murein DD-endopeptidase MepM/ murein hydrolase activator NlpD
MVGMLAALIASALCAASNAEDVTISTRPKAIYKVPEQGRLASEAWIAYLLVSDKQRRALRPRSAQINYLSKGNVVSGMMLSESALKSSAIPVGGGSDLVFCFKQRSVAPIADSIDEMKVEILLSQPTGEDLAAESSIPIVTYQPKTELHYPLRLPGIVLNGYGIDGGHAAWGQLFALDISGLDKNYGIMRPTGSKNSDFAGWNKDVLAPAAGTIAYARNDVPDQENPEAMDESTFSKLPEPNWASGGNVVAIDHGNGEFSVLCHMRQGSVKVKVGDQVKLGQVLGHLGNSGNAYGPHLHYQLQSSLAFNQCDSLPVKFVDISQGLYRGSYLTPHLAKQGGHL